MSIVFKTLTENLVYRIPVICKTQEGSLLAFCEKRYDGLSDTGKIEIVVKRSLDNGKYWSNEIVVFSDGYNTCGNPCPIISNDGTIYLIFTWNDGKYNERDILKGKSKRVPYYTKSIDDGITWEVSKKLKGDITEDNWFWYATGPNIGLEIDNRLIVACNHSENSDKPVYKAHVLFSDDKGLSWSKSESLDINTNESGVVEFNNKTIVVSRVQGKTKRYISISDDKGETFNKTYLSSFKTGICQGSVIKFKEYIVVSAPINNNRDKLTFNFSKDLETWHKKTVYLGPSGYSSLVKLDEESIGVFYERDNYSKLYFQTIKFDSLFEEDKPEYIWGFTKKYYNNEEKIKKDIDFNKELSLYFDQVSEVWEDDCLSIIVCIDNINFIVNFDRMKMYSLKKNFDIETNRNLSIKLKMYKKKNVL